MVQLQKRWRKRTKKGAVSQRVYQRTTKDYEVKEYRSRSLCLEAQRHCSGTMVPTKTVAL